MQVLGRRAKADLAEKLAIAFGAGGPGIANYFSQSVGRFIE
jgi:hypothetical protein